MANKSKNSKGVNGKPKEIDWEAKLKSDDYLEKALNATSKVQVLKYTKKALELDNENIDAMSLVAETIDNSIKRLEKYDEVLEKAKNILIRDNIYVEENIGDFYFILETRPYMRLLYKKILLLQVLGRYTDLIDIAEEALKLCENDNLGVRYTLIVAYTALEKFSSCEKLYKKYKGDTAFMLFPMAIMYYRKGDYKKSKKFIKELYEANPYIIDAFMDEDGLEMDEDEEIEYYSIGSPEEARLALENSLVLLMSTPSFIEFFMEVVQEIE